MALRTDGRIIFNSTEDSPCQEVIGRSVGQEVPELYGSEGSVPLTRPPALQKLGKGTRLNPSAASGEPAFQLPLSGSTLHFKRLRPARGPNRVPSAQFLLSVARTFLIVNSTRRRKSFAITIKQRQETLLLARNSILACLPHP